MLVTVIYTDICTLKGPTNSEVNHMSLRYAEMSF